MYKNNIFLSNQRNTHKKKYLLYFLPILLIICMLLYFYISYQMLFNDFKTKFTNNNFADANSILLSKGNYNPVKSFFLKNDLQDYFSNVINTLEKKVDSDNVDKTQILNIISEIDRYNFISVDTKNILNSLNYEDPYQYALTLYNNEQYQEAYNVFKTVPTSNTHYEDAVNYSKNCKDTIKSDILKQVDDLCVNNFYTKALNLIDTVSDIIGNDKDILEKVESITNEKNEFIAKLDSDTLETSSLVVDNLSSKNINSLSIDSLTNYLIHVDLQNQKTYIYSGSKNSWALAKTFSCSTGVSGSDTPEGIFTIKERGDWFFSDKYQQGAKYWVQFSGNYLFHSFPYDESQSNILDYTLGTPSSHGCIRLSVEDSKWIYDNIPSNTKVIIK